MAKFNNPTKVITGVNTRWSYVNAWEAKSINGGAPKFSVSLIIPKSDTATVEKIKADTRHFAKRQITWYKKMPYIHWFTVDRNLNYEKIVTEMADILEKKVKRM